MQFLKPKGTIHEKGPALLLAAYLGFSAIWIIGTDLLLESLQLNGTWWQTLKGLAYLSISGTILYTLARKFLNDARRLETTLTQLIEQTEFGVCFAALDASLLECNRATAEFLGYTQEELQGKRYLEVVHPDERAEAIQGWQAAVDGGGSSVHGLRRKFIRKDGETVWEESPLPGSVPTRGTAVFWSRCYTMSRPRCRPSKHFGSAKWSSRHW